MASHPRILFVTIDGTWAGSVRHARQTVVSELPNLMVDHKGDVVWITAEGIGSSDGPHRISRYLSALGGRGTWRKVIDQYRNLALNFASGDRIVLCGYSRGAWAVRCLAQMIHSIGLPKNARGDHLLFHRLYKADDSVLDSTSAVARSITNDYKFRHDVEIDALCCFDTVGSLGLPFFGIARPLSRLFPQKRPDVISTVAPNVRHAFHCLSLHEEREPFAPTLMAGPNVHQVFFLGTHGDMGWVEDGEPLVLAPLAWMIQQLTTHVGIRFDPIKMAARFPAYDLQLARDLAARQSPVVATKNRNGGPGWWEQHIARRTPFLLAIIGKKHRQPGKGGPHQPAADRGSQDDIADGHGQDASPLTGGTQGSSALPTPAVQVHVGARLRHPRNKSAAIVPGYVLAEPPNERPHWVRSTSSKSRPQQEKRQTEPGVAISTSCTEDRDDAYHGQGQYQTYRHDRVSNGRQSGRRACGLEVLPDKLTEAPVGPLEAALLGIAVHLL